MIRIVRQLVVITMLVVVSTTGAFAQRGRGHDKRPPKEPVKVITNDRKDNRPPRQEEKKPKPDNRRRGRPFF